MYQVFVGQPNQISYAQWQRSPLTARRDISKAQNMVIRHTGLSITIYFAVGSCIKGHDNYSRVHTLQGLWFLLAFKSFF